MPQLRAWMEIPRVQIPAWVAAKHESLRNGFYAVPIDLLENIQSLLAGSGCEVQTVKCFVLTLEETLLHFLKLLQIQHISTYYHGD